LARICHRVGRHGPQACLLQVPGEDRLRQEGEHGAPQRRGVEGQRPSLLRDEPDRVWAADRIGAYDLVALDVRKLDGLPRLARQFFEAWKRRAPDVDARAALLKSEEAGLKLIALSVGVSGEDALLV
jgi:hypothetical protein